MNKFKQTATLTLLAIGIGFTGAIHASLFDRGNGLIYDSTLNITWAQNANLFQAQAASDQNLVSQIIANIGTVSDSIGTHILTVNDFNASAGKMSWYGAQAWVSNLNLQGYDGYNDWRLPTLGPADGISFNYNSSFDGSTDLGWNTNSPHSEMGYLFNVELQNLEILNLLNGTTNPNGWSLNPKISFQDAAHNGVNDSFNNFQSDGYWAALEFAPETSGAWSFNTWSGGQTVYGKGNLIYALAVLPGDVAPVPEPGAVWLFASGLGLLSFTRRKNQNS